MLSTPRSQRFPAGTLVSLALLLLACGACQAERRRPPYVDERCIITPVPITGNLHALLEYDLVDGSSEHLAGSIRITNRDGRAIVFADLDNAAHARVELENGTWFLFDVRVDPQRRDYADVTLRRDGLFSDPKIGSLRLAIHGPPNGYTVDWMPRMFGEKHGPDDQRLHIQLSDQRDRYVTLQLHRE